MLIQFSVENYKVFREKAVLSMVASNYYKENITETLIPLPGSGNLSLLSSVVIYGPNASGKSKLLNALYFMIDFVFKASTQMQINDKIKTDIHRLNLGNLQRPSTFEIIITYKNIRYRYGFEVTSDKVIEEWLFIKPKTKEIQFFYRKGQDYSIHENDFKIGKKLVADKMIRDNALLLSVAAQFNEHYAINLIEWFINCNIISAVNDFYYQSYAISQLENPKRKKTILALLHAADLGIDDIFTSKINFEDFSKDRNNSQENRSPKSIFTKHSIYNEFLLKTNQTANFNFMEDESSGTQRFFALCGIIIDTLENGKILVIDELEVKMHTDLVLLLVNLFNNKKYNAKNAQLIFTTHDINLMKRAGLRRDQIWFIEKDNYGASKLFSLADIKNVRKGEDIQGRYLDGRYGAVPFVNLKNDIIQQ